MMYPRYLDFLPMRDVHANGVPMRSVTPYWYSPWDGPGSDLVFPTPRGDVYAYFSDAGEGRIEDGRKP